MVNLEGTALGTVAELTDNGAHQNLVVQQAGEDGKTIERLIPFVDAHVSTVDLAGKRIVVDWQADY